MPDPSRRWFLRGAGATLGTVGLAGCLGGRFAPAASDPDVTVYVGSYHWGFVLLDEAGTERDRVVVDPGTTLRLVAFNTEAHEVVEGLPSSVRGALPGHEALEERNEARVPAPPSGDLHDALAEANARYPDHSVAVVPTGFNEMPMGRGGYGSGGDGDGGWGMGGGGDGMGGGMMLHPVPLPHDALRPAVAGLAAADRGNYSLSCLTYCGYGHAFMELPGALVVR